MSDEKEVRELGLSVDLDQSYSDEARIREAELQHEAAMEQLQFDREKYLASRPKSEREIELEYAFKNRELDRELETDRYERSWPRKAEKATVAVAIVGVAAGAFKWLFDHTFPGGGES